MGAKINRDDGDYLKDEGVRNSDEYLLHPFCI